MRCLAEETPALQNHGQHLGLDQDSHQDLDSGLDPDLDVGLDQDLVLDLNQDQVYSEPDHCWFLR